MTLKEIYDAVASLKMYDNQVAVLEDGKFSDGSEGVWVYACDCQMSGDYPTKNKKFIIGADIANFLGSNYKALKVSSDGELFPVYDSWDGYQPYDIQITCGMGLEKPRISTIKKGKPIYDF